MDRFPPNLQNLIYKYLAIENAQKVSGLFVNGLRSFGRGLHLKRINRCCICRETFPTRTYLYNYRYLPYRLLPKYICEPCVIRYHDTEAYRTWEYWGKIDS